MTEDSSFIVAFLLWSLFSMKGQKCGPAVKDSVASPLNFLGAPKHASVLVLALLVAALLGTAPVSAQQFLTKFGSLGSGHGQLNLPQGIALDNTGPEGLVWVADTNNHRIQRFVCCRDIRADIVIGSEGKGDGQFMLPTDLDFNPTPQTGGQALYVADTLNNRIQKFDKDGSFLFMWGWGVLDGAPEFQICERFCRAGIAGDGEGQFMDPIAVSVRSDLDGTVFVLDSGNTRIQSFDPDGNFINAWGMEGSEDGQLKNPMDLFAEGNIVIVADTGNNRVQIFDGDGKFLSKFGTEGNGQGEFTDPMGITMGFNEDLDESVLFISDAGNSRIEIFTIQGPEPFETQFVNEFGSFGGDDGQFNTPTSMAFVDDPGELYVSDTNNNRIQIFEIDGGAPGSGVGGGGGGGCSIAPEGSKPSILLGLFLVMPAFILVRRMWTRLRT